ncbi:MAG: SUF system Fe-S cluster assembly protein [Gammaproteobacteria bacterium]
MEPSTPGTDTRPADDSLEARIIDAMRSVFDPEIPVNIYDLGLIYGLDINADADVSVRMTLTAPGCPVAGILPEQVANAIRAVDGVNAVQVELVWDPPWDQDCMSDEARLTLGLF